MRRVATGIVALLGLTAASGTGAATSVDARITLDSSGGGPIAGQEFLVVVAVESIPVPNGRAFDFTVTVTLPDGLEFRSASPGQPTTWTCTSSGQSLTCRGRNIGGEITSNVNLRLRAARAGSYVIQASVAIDGQPDTNQANDTAALDVTVAPASSPSTARCVVPRVTGRMLAAARRAISAAGCRVGRVNAQYSSRVPKGRVLRQSPTAGRRVARGTRVSLAVSRGAR